jgi:hypothetical protein
LKKIEIAFDGLFKYNQKKSKEIMRKKYDIGNSNNNTNVIMRSGMKQISNNNNNKNEDNNKENDNEINNQFEENNNTKGNINNNINDNINQNVNDNENGNENENENENEEIYLGKLVDVKYSYYNIFFAISKIKFVIDVENTIEKSLRNLTEKHEINSLNKKEFQFVMEFLRAYYNIESEMIKKPNDHSFHVLMKNCQEAKIPKIRLSLLALTLKNRNFMRIPYNKENIILKKDKIIYHPFEKSLYIQDYRLHVTVEMIDKFLADFVPMTQYYVYEISPGNCYVHFFDKYMCNKVYKELKSKTNQFQDCYEVNYYYDENWSYKDFYLYLRNDIYFSYLNNYHGKLDDSLLYTKVNNDNSNVNDNLNDNYNINSNYNPNENKDKKIVGNLDFNKVSNNLNEDSDDGFTVVKKKKKK